jgi:hypothetical protein
MVLNFMKSLFLQLVPLGGGCELLAGLDFSDRLFAGMFAVVTSLQPFDIQ